MYSDSHILGSAVTSQLEQNQVKICLVPHSLACKTVYFTYQISPKLMSLRDLICGTEEVLAWLYQPPSLIKISCQKAGLWEWFCWRVFAENILATYGRYGLCCMITSVQLVICGCTTVVHTFCWPVIGQCKFADPRPGNCDTENWIMRDCSIPHNPFLGVAHELKEWKTIQLWRSPWGHTMGNNGYLIICSSSRPVNIHVEVPTKLMRLIYKIGRASCRERV